MAYVLLKCHVEKARRRLKPGSVERARRGP